MRKSPLPQDIVVRIKAENPSDAVCNQYAYKKLMPHFSWESEAWIQGQFSKKRKTYREHPFVKHEVSGFYYFPTGLIPKALKLCKENKWGCKFENTGFNLGATKPEMPKGFKFRPHQLKAIKAATKAGRGVIHASTASGKTITAFGIFQAYLLANPGEKCLFLAHTIDLVKQAAKEFTDLGGNVGILQGETRTDGEIICATIQTLEKMGIDAYQNEFITVIVDECHKIASFTGRYAQVIQNSFCPTRFAVTATLPNKPEAKVALEAIIGPVLDTFSISDGIKAGVLSTPKIFFVPYDNAFMGDFKTYKDIYQKNIVQNKSRNTLIAKIAKNLAEKEQSSLIFVRHIEHGDNISKILKSMGVGHFWINGQSDKEVRIQLKSVLEKKEVMIGICSTIWNEGISIKSLNNCILAGAGKDEKMVLQVVGRGTRVDEGKDTVLIWDFLDPQKLLAQQCIERMIVYREQGWIVSILKKKEK